MSIVRDTDILGIFPCNRGGGSLNYVVNFPVGRGV